MKLTLSLMVLALAAAATPALAYGTFEPANELGTTLRTRVADPAYAEADRQLAGQGMASAERRIDYGEDNRTWQLYEDKNRNGAREEGEGNVSVLVLGDVPVLRWYHVRVDGTPNDHLEVNLTNEDTRLHGMRARVCTGQAAQGLDGVARGLRCNGDMDRDGEGDFSEIPNENPFHPGRDDDDDPLPPPLLP